MSEPGDDIRKIDGIDPKVRGAIADIADAGNHSITNVIRTSLKKEIWARGRHSKREGQNIGADILSAVLANPDMLRKQLSTIVASQGLTPEDVDRLLSDIKTGRQKERDSGHESLNPFRSVNKKMYDEGSVTESAAMQILLRAAQSGVDASIHSLKTSETPDASQQGAEKEELW